MRAAPVLTALDGAGDELTQVLAVLRAAGEPEPETLSLGDGDRRLLDLLRAVTARDLELTVECPHCATLSSAVISGAGVAPTAPRVAMLGAGGGLREPTYADLLDLPPDEDEAAAELLRRCVVGEPAAAPSPEALALVDQALTGPIGLACPECGEPVAIDVDVQVAVLDRLARQARIIDEQVHLLAGAYHWSLDEIEALPDARRAALARRVADDA